MTEQLTTTPIEPRAFRETLGSYPTGVVVVTGLDGEGVPRGFAVGSFTSVSLDPPLVGFMITRGSGSFQRMRTGGSFCVNVLAADQEDVCRHFASGIIDKFARTAWRPAPSGAPILDGVVSWVDCSYESISEGGDHLIVLGRVTGLAVERRTQPLLFYRGGYGHFNPLPPGEEGRDASKSPGQSA
ncbi:flavin reductase (DIM6/NTAB) family NADH-FMN oxidoreductase RutF [Actinomadura pelletieri DSM 43383]|uniref:Flavin reductase (DIM6/NTAB) family NADH-FMN oxidoreductase RutF n=1 Tax=Actinomadura pelletieri DSM 43383 TaxID=1120940 RepID=A0A495QXW5_9ACTN|nr:flavin reductase family protein [Actinomadura pelletieri]RKS78756.1 flavin reductase (DIM6/NTAB) family NADH-FMN oxidoreductase RutF [Actinomadura pelletieri DSM 43383]